MSVSHVLNHLLSISLVKSHIFLVLFITLLMNTEIAKSPDIKSRQFGVTFSMEGLILSSTQKDSMNRVFTNWVKNKGSKFADKLESMGVVGVSNVEFRLEEEFVANKTIDYKLYLKSPELSTDLLLGNEDLFQCNIGIFRKNDEFFLRVLNQETLEEFRNVGLAKMMLESLIKIYQPKAVLFNEPTPDGLAFIANLIKSNILGKEVPSVSGLRATFDQMLCSVVGN